MRHDREDRLRKHFRRAPAPTDDCTSRLECDRVIVTSTNARHAAEVGRHEGLTEVRHCEGSGRACAPAGNGLIFFDRNRVDSAPSDRNDNAKVRWRRALPSVVASPTYDRAALFDSDRVGVTCSNLFDSTEAGWWRALRVLIRTPAECAARLSMCRYGERDVQQR